MAWPSILSVPVTIQRKINQETAGELFLLRRQVGWWWSLFMHAQHYWSNKEKCKNWNKGTYFSYFSTFIIATSMLTIFSTFNYLHKSETVCTSEYSDKSLTEGVEGFRWDIPCKRTLLIKNSFLFVKVKDGRWRSYIMISCPTLKNKANGQIKNEGNLI